MTTKPTCQEPVNDQIVVDAIVAHVTAELQEALRLGWINRSDAAEWQSTTIELRVVAYRRAVEQTAADE